MKKMASYSTWWWAAVLALAAFFSPIAVGGENSTGPNEPSYRDVIEADWTLQEERKGRRPDDQEAVEAVYRSASMLLALRRPASKIGPAVDGSMPLSFPRLVQPVLDRHCVACHDGSQGPGKSPLVLTGERQDPFTRSYQNLRAFARWHEWGQDTITPIITRPGHLGADESPLTRIFDDETHAESVNLPDEDLRRIYIWLDANAPFYGTYSQAEQDAQLAGEPVRPPGVQ